MGLTLGQRIQQFFGREFTLEGDEIITIRIDEPQGYKVTQLVPLTGEKVYEAMYSRNSKKPAIEWIGPNYVRYCLFT